MKRFANRMRVPEINIRILIGLMIMSLTITGLILVALYVLGGEESVAIVSVRKVESYLGNDGYHLKIYTEASKPTVLAYIDYGGRIIKVYYTVPSGSGMVDVAVGDIPPPDRVRIIFREVSPKEVNVVKEEYQQQLEMSVYGSKIVLHGTVPEPISLVAIPIKEEATPRIVVLTSPAIYTEVKLLEEKYSFLKIVIPKNISIGLLRNSTSVIFFDVVPSRELLNRLSSYKIKAVVAPVVSKWGEFVVDVNGSKLVLVTEPDESKLPLLRSCVIKPSSRLYSIYDENIKKIVKRLALTYVISPIAPCIGAGEVKAKTRYDEGVIVDYGSYLYVSSYTLEPLIYIAMLSVPGATIYDITPFRGVKIIDTEKASSYVVFVIYGDKITHNIIEPKLGSVTWSIGKPVYLLIPGHGTARVTIYEETFSGDVLRIVYSNETSLPATINFQGNISMVYTVYINDSFAGAIYYQPPKSPYYRVEYNNVYETFYILVETRGCEVPNQLQLWINGRFYGYICTNNVERIPVSPMDMMSLEIRDYTGKVLVSYKFEVVHIYQTPAFLMAVGLALVIALAPVGYYIKKKLHKPLIKITLKYRYKVEEYRIIPTEQEVLRALEQFREKYKRLPTLSELYKWVNVVEVKDLTKVLRDMIRKKKLYMVALYSPELDDTITVVAKTPQEALRNAMLNIVREVGSIISGIEIFETKEYRALIPAEYGVSARDSIMFMEIVTSEKEIPHSLTEIFKTFTMSRRYNIPFKVVGISIITLPELYPKIMDIIDKIVIQHDMSVVEEYLKDTTVIRDLTSYAKSVLLSSFIIVAAPITRVANLMACLKVNNPKLANVYYRLLAREYKKIYPFE